MTRQPYSFRASADEMHAIEEAARVIGVPPRALIRNAAVATAQRVLDAVAGAAREAAGSVASQTDPTCTRPLTRRHGCRAAGSVPPPSGEVGELLRPRAPGDGGGAKSTTERGDRGREAK